MRSDVTAAGAKRLVARAAFYSRAPGLLRRARRTLGLPATPILVYHRVVAQDECDTAHLPLAAARCRSGMAVTAANFDAQMRHLARRYEVMPLSQIVARLREGAPLPPRACAVTFDDGYADNYRLAYPILKRLRLPATFFLATGFIGTSEAPWTARLERVFVSPEGNGPDRQLLRKLKALPVDRAEALVAEWEAGLLPDHAARSTLHAAGDVAGRHAVAPLRAARSELRAASEASMMTWEQVSEMRADGFEFGGHTRRHALLAREEPARAREEIDGSLVDLTTHLGPGEYGFAYPNGSRNSEICAWVRAAGYQYACGMTDVLCGPGADLFDLPRRDVNTLKTTGPDGRFCAAMFTATVEDLWLASLRRSRGDREL